MTTILEGVGAKVVAVASASEALARIDEVRPSVLISDIAMPDQDGRMLIKELRRRGSRIPAIAVSAYDRSADREAALRAGFQSYVTKPVEPSRLFEVINELCGGSGL